MPIKGLTDLKQITSPVECPLCIEPMHIVFPTNYDDWKSFYGCDDFPSCTGTRGIKPDGSIETDDEALRSMAERFNAEIERDNGYHPDDFFEFWYGGRH